MKNLFVALEQGEETHIHNFDLISMALQTTPLTSHRGDSDKCAHI